MNPRTLEALAARVARLCNAINNPGVLPMAQEWSWAELTHEAIPELMRYLNQKANTP